MLKATLKKYPCVWLGWSGEVKRRPKTRTVTRGDNSYIVSDLTPEDFEEYYNGFANRVLWPILHYRLDLAEFSRRDLSGYMRVNEHFADQLAKVLRPDDIVWVHDYHLIPLAPYSCGRADLSTGSAFSCKSRCRSRKSLPPCPITSISFRRCVITIWWGSRPMATPPILPAIWAPGTELAHCSMPSSPRGRLGTPARPLVMRIGTFPVGIETRPIQDCLARAVWPHRTGAR